MKTDRTLMAAGMALERVYPAGDLGAAGICASRTVSGATLLRDSEGRRAKDSVAADGGGIAWVGRLEDTTVPQSAVVNAIFDQPMRGPASRPSIVNSAFEEAS
jgi:hypothetical protein